MMRPAARCGNGPRWPKWWWAERGVGVNRAGAQRAARVPRTPGCSAAIWRVNKPHCATMKVLNYEEHLIFFQ